MGSEPPPSRQVELACVEDGDFGPMRFVLDVFHSQSPGGAWREHEMYSWHGKVAGAELSIDAEKGELAPAGLQVVRQALLNIARDADAFRLEIAERMLRLALEWAESGDLPAPTLGSLAAAIKLSSVRASGHGELFIYFDELCDDVDDAIFAGHVIEVRMDANGAIQSSHIAG